MPQYIPDDFAMKLVSRERNLEQARSFLEEQPTNYEVPNFTVPYGYKLLQSKTKKHNDGEVKLICLVTDSQEAPEIVYELKLLIRDTPNAYLNQQNATQLIVWRTFEPVHQPALRDFAKTIFAHLLTTYNIMITDEQQTSDGKSFWIFRMAEAIESPDSRVFYIDLNELDENMAPLTVEIDSYGELREKYVPMGWGHDESHKERAFAIFKTK